MMISPETYVKQHIKDPLDQLIKERDALIADIQDLESELFGNKKPSEEVIMPTPSVQYQMKLEYLGLLCRFICLKYNREVVHSEKIYKEDLKELGLR